MTEDVELAGHTIRAGDGVIIARAIGNRDPEVSPSVPSDSTCAATPAATGSSARAYTSAWDNNRRAWSCRSCTAPLYRRILTLRLATGLNRIPFKDDAFIYGVHELPVTW